MQLRKKPQTKNPINQGVLANNRPVFNLSLIVNILVKIISIKSFSQDLEQNQADLSHIYLTDSTLFIKLFSKSVLEFLVLKDLFLDHYEKHEIITKVKKTIFKVLQKN